MVLYQRKSGDEQVDEVEGKVVLSVAPTCLARYTANS
jgi:hypothetical protein